MNSKPIIYTAIAVTALGVGSVLGAVGIQKVAAEDNTGTYSTIVQNIAAKFGLKEADVQQVFEDTREQKYEARLDEAVSDGDITSDQKTKIIEKHKEVEAKIKEIDAKELTAADRRSEMRSLMEEVKAWADENDIPARFVMFGGGMGKGHEIHGDGMGPKGMMM